MVLHNILIDIGWDEDGNVTWDVDYDELTEIHAADRITKRSALNLSFPGRVLANERQEKLLANVLQAFMRRIKFNPFLDSIYIDLDIESTMGNLLEEVGSMGYLLEGI